MNTPTLIRPSRRLIRMMMVRFPHMAMIIMWFVGFVIVVYHFTKYIMMDGLW